MEKPINSEDRAKKIEAKKKNVPTSKKDTTPADNKSRNNTPRSKSVETKNDKITKNDKPRAVSVIMPVNVSKNRKDIATRPENVTADNSKLKNKSRDLSAPRKITEISNKTQDTTKATVFDKASSKTQKLKQVLNSLQTFNVGNEKKDPMLSPKLEPPTLPKHLTANEAPQNTPVRIPVGINKEFLNIQYRPTENIHSTPTSSPHSSRYSAHREALKTQPPIVDMLAKGKSIYNQQPNGTPIVHSFQGPPSIPRNFQTPSTLTNNSKLRAIIQQFPPRDDLKILREKVDAAIESHRTFTVMGGYNTIRKSLITRGWVERFAINYVPMRDNGLFKRLQAMTIQELGIGVHDKENGNLYKQMITSKMLSNHKVDFYWDFNRDNYKQFAINANCTMINVIRRGVYNYANKQGLCECMKQAHWFNNPGVSYLRHPRSYNLVNNGDPDDFINDFKITAAMSLLKWIISTYEAKSSKLISEAGKISITCFHFAISECNKFLQKMRHEDIDQNIQVAVEHEWEDFLEHYYKGVHVGNHFKESLLENETTLVHKSRIMLKRLKKYWPYLEMDGFMNIWILKPAFGSRGIGIYICRTLQYVLKVIKEHKESTYVIQKYIERPLLIHNTKFDIRQWFLISQTSPLVIWIYKECYLRFSSQTYNLRKLHESIHLTNNSVQSRYENHNRDPGLPTFNMWHSDQFKTHLESIGYPNAFNDIIYPGMRECIVAAVMSNQEFMNTRKNSFELHGADFMITEDFKPWLIEINSRPALYASTPITSKMCPMVLEDCIKVVVDKARDHNAGTGLFELSYEDKLEVLPPPDPAGLTIMGRPTPPNYFYTPSQAVLPKKAAESNDSFNIGNTVEYMKYIGTEMKSTLNELLELIAKERERRSKLRKEKKTSTQTESLNYCEEMDKLKSNFKEIEEIYKYEINEAHQLCPESTEAFNQVAMMDLMEHSNIEELVDIPKSSDSVLLKNSQKLEKALATIEKGPSGTETVQTTINSIFGIIGNVSFYSKRPKPTYAASASAILNTK